MANWTIETCLLHRVLIHACPSALPGDTAHILRQDIGGGYVRCDRCGDKFLPPTDPGDARLILRLQIQEVVESKEKVYY
jgi:hypothetical protein